MSTLSLLIMVWLSVLGCYLLILALVQSIIGVFSVWGLFQQEKENASLAPETAPEVAAIIAAHNEEGTLPTTLKSLENQTVWPAQLIIVNDGSTDDTERVAHSCLSASPIEQSTVLTTHRGGMGKALQAGLDEVNSPLTCFINADVEIDSQVIERLRCRFADPAVTAMSVWVWPLIPTGRKSLVAYALIICQIIEYARAILWRPGWQKLGALSIVEGRFGMFRTGPLKGTQTLRTTPSAIDYALTLELHRQAHEQHRPCKIGIEPKATVWTDVPLTLHTFFAQRMRYASGFFRAYAINRAMLLRREYGVLGLFELPVRIFTSFFATAEFFLWVTCLLLAIARHRLAATAWLILAAYTMFVIAQLYLSLALAKRFTVYRWRAGFNWLLWLMVPLVAMTWEPIKGVANLAGWIKMPWRQGPWQTLRQGQGTRLVEVEICPTISHTQVNQALKKTNSSRI